LPTVCYLKDKVTYSGGIAMSLKPQPPRPMPAEIASWGANHLADDDPYKLVGDTLYEHTTTKTLPISTTKKVNQHSHQYCSRLSPFSKPLSMFLSAVTVKPAFVNAYSNIRISATA